MEHLGVRLTRKKQHRLHGQRQQTSWLRNQKFEVYSIATLSKGYQNFERIELVRT